MDNAIFRLQRRFYCLPTNMIIKLYKIRCERLRMLMRKGMPEDVQMIIERNFVRKLDGKLVLDSEKAFKPFLDIKPEEDVSYNNNYYNAVENGFVSTKARNVLISATTIEELLDKL
ncbi:hypothetical protein E1A91_A11G323000v1 [Gossypium mustelinum]|uniref:Uncharacterized protein n=1 Tax=Gossypium mustelinum TaxID=34275 RepID=A0A5D2XDH0_GOSMU|nr:hypothetical protein E1A91_A11G323000v1 [Gossypium mustelinum]